MALRADEARSRGVIRSAAGAVLLCIAPACASAQASPKFAGLYEIRQMEMAGGLELLPTGRFRYALEYGAASEEAEGDWESEGDVVRLTSNPIPTAPSFELVKDEPAENGELYVELEPPGFGSWTGRLDLLATVAGEREPRQVEARSDGLVWLEGATATSIRPVVPIYGNIGDSIDIGPGGHRLLLRFHANDLGKVRFDREPLAAKDGNLLMQRYDTIISFRPVRP